MEVNHVVEVQCSQTKGDMKCVVLFKKDVVLFKKGSCEGKSFARENPLIADNY